MTTPNFPALLLRDLRAVATSGRTDPAAVAASVALSTGEAGFPALALPGESPDADDTARVYLGGPLSAYLDAYRDGSEGPAVYLYDLVIGAPPEAFAALRVGFPDEATDGDEDTRPRYDWREGVLRVSRLDLGRLLSGLRAVRAELTPEA